MHTFGVVVVVLLMLAALPLGFASIYYRYRAVYLRRPHVSRWAWFWGPMLMTEEELTPEGITARKRSTQALFLYAVTFLAAIVVLCATGDFQSTAREERTEKWEYRWTAS
jgi:hypothetical protein